MGNDIGCCKYLMFFFNLLIFIGGIALLAIGIWVVVGADSFKQVISNDPTIFNAVYLIIAVGAFLFIVGFLGCCGAIKENKCLLGTFFVLILLIFILEITGAVLAFVFYPKAKQVALDSMKLYGTSTEEGKSITAAWDTFQQTFKCCGIDGQQDWFGAGILDPPAPCVSTKSVSTGINLTPCSEAIQHYFWILGGIAIGVLVVELLAMVFACCIYRNVGKDRYA